MFVKMLLLISSLTLYGCAASPSEAKSSKDQGCQVAELKAVFERPQDFDGKKFCGEAYYFSNGINAFYPRAIARDDPLRLNTALVISPGEMLSGSRKLGGLKSGERVHVSGVLEVDGDCFKRNADDRNVCVPIAHPIYLHSWSIGAAD